MWLFACGLIVSIGFILAEKPVSKQVNTTNAANNISKRYIITIPQYNALLYTNSQVLPKQQLLFDNSQGIIDTNLQGKSAPYSVPPNYYFLNNNIAPPYVIQNVAPQIPKNLVSAAPQQLFLQRLLQQEVVPQQVIQQQVPPQRIIQNVVPQIQSAQQVSPQQFVQSTVPQQLPQRIIQGVVKQQVIPTQVLRQQIVPQQALLQRIVPQGIVPQQLLVPQLLSQQIIPQRLATPQTIPQRLIPQQTVPPKVVPQQIITQRTPNIPVLQSQGIPSPIQNNILPGIVQQQISVPSPIQNNIFPGLVRQQILPFQFSNVPIHLQYPFYQAESPRPRISVNKEPYPYEIPPGQAKLPVNAAHYSQIQVNPSPPPQYGVPQYRYEIPRGQTKEPIHTGNHAQIHVNPPPPPQYGVPQHFIYNPGDTAYRQQQQINPQHLYINPYTQSTTGNGEQVVRIGFGHPHQTHHEAVQNTQPQNHPHTIYIHPNIDNSQQEVKIGYGHLLWGLQGNDDGPQQIKLEIPLAYSDVADNQNRGIGYQYENNARSARTVEGSENGTFKLTEAEKIKP